MPEKQGQNINDLIFRELIKRGYSQEGKTRIWNIADSKLWYLTPEQAQAYLNLLDSESYKSEFGPKEMTLIAEHISMIVETVAKEPLNLVDIGCGDGRKAKIFVKEISKKNKMRYCPIDISGYMVDKAIKAISKYNAGEIIESKWNISDFENLENITPLLNQEPYKRNLFLLLGNTLGNFELHDLLYQIRSCMKSGDYLLIGNGIENKNMEETIKFLKKNKLNNEFLIKIPLQLGLNKEDIELGVRFANHRIEFYYTIKKEKNITFNEKTIEFKKEDQLLVAVAYHYNKEDLKEFLNLYFANVTLKLSEDNSYALAFCKK
jgi:uncharacterized SAM-dependent methyltransferase